MDAYLRQKIDIYGQISIAISLALLTYALTETSSLGWSAIPLSGMGLAALALLPRSG